MEWDKLLRRYIYSDAKTPYFTAVDDLTRVQARNEVFIYVLFLGVLFAVIGIASLSPKLPHGDTMGPSIFAFVMVWAAVLFGATKHGYAAVFCASAPVAALLYFVLYGFHPILGTADKVLIVGLVLLWLRYSWRILGIAKAYPDMAEGTHDQ